MHTARSRSSGPTCGRFPVAATLGRVAGGADRPRAENGGRPGRIGASERRLGGVEMTGSGHTSYTSPHPSTALHLTRKEGAATGGNPGLGRALSIALAGQTASL